MADPAGTELNAGIAHACLFETGQFLQTLHGQFTDRDFGIDAKGRLELFGLQCAASECVHAFTKGVELVRTNAQAGGHGVATVAHEQVAALAQGGREIESFDAAPRAAPLVAFAANDNRRAIKFLENARGHDADDADVPQQLSFDQNKISRSVKPRSDGPNDFFADAALDVLPLAIARTEAFRDWFRFCKVPREQEAQSLFGIFQAARGIESRCKLESHFISADWPFDAGDFLERDDSRALRGREALQTGADQDAVLTRERNEIGNGPERNEIEERTEIEFLRAGQVRGATVLENRVRQFESEADGAKFGEGRWFES